MKIRSRATDRTAAVEFGRDEPRGLRNRCSMLTPLVLLLVVPNAEPNEAEKLFHQMETKVMRAKTLESDFETKIEENKQKVTMMGTLFLGDGNKVRVEKNYEVDGKKQKTTLVADGTKMIALLEGYAPKPAV